LGCGLGVEAQSRAWPVAERDRAELIGVFVNPCACDPELPGKLARIDELRRHPGRAGGFAGWVVAQELGDTVCDLLDRIGGQISGGPPHACPRPDGPGRGGWALAVGG
jgi:hypothetical protein